MSKYGGLISIDEVAENHAQSSEKYQGF